VITFPALPDPAISRWHQRLLDDEAADETCLSESIADCSNRNSQPRQPDWYFFRWWR
jgi:hypothetical protein